MKNEQIENEDLENEDKENEDILCIILYIVEVIIECAIIVGIFGICWNVAIAPIFGCTKITFIQSVALCSFIDIIGVFFWKNKNND